MGVGDMLVDDRQHGRPERGALRDGQGGAFLFVGEGWNLEPDFAGEDASHSFQLAVGGWQLAEL